jgi:hypothetical protein
VSVEGHRGENNFVPVRYIMVASSTAGIRLGGKAVGGPRSVSDGGRRSYGVVEVGSGVWNRLGW